MNIVHESADSLSVSGAATCRFVPVPVRKALLMDPASVFRNLLLMAASDGRVDEAELRLLSDRATEWGISDDEFEAAIQDAVEGRAELTLPPELEARQAILKDMLRMMGADGRMSRAEKELFALASSVVGIDQAALNRLIDDVLREDL